MHKQYINSVFCLYTVKSHDFTVQVQGKKKKKEKKKQNVYAWLSGIQTGTKRTNKTASFESLNSNRLPVKSLHTSSFPCVKWRAALTIIFTSLTKSDTHSLLPSLSPNLLMLFPVHLPHRFLLHLTLQSNLMYQ